MTIVYPQDDCLESDQPINGGITAFNAIYPMEWNGKDLSILYASALEAGAVTTSNQTFAGTKTFDAIKCSALPNVSADITNKGYVDDLVTKSISWHQEVISFLDLFSSPPVSPSDGDRYISTVTSGIFTTNYIYQWASSTSNWVEIIPTEGWTLYCRSGLINPDQTITYNGIAWVNNGNSIQHQSLIGAGTLTHADIDSYLDQSVKIASTPTFFAVQAFNPAITAGNTVNILIGKNTASTAYFQYMHGDTLPTQRIDIGFFGNSGILKIGTANSSCKAGSVFTFNDTTDSTSTSSGAIINLGGMGIAKKLHVGDNIVAHCITDQTKIGTININTSGNLSLTTTGTLALTSTGPVFNAPAMTTSVIEDLTTGQCLRLITTATGSATNPSNVITGATLVAPLQHSFTATILNGDDGIRCLSTSHTGTISGGYCNVVSGSGDIAGYAITPSVETDILQGTLRMKFVVTGSLTAGFYLFRMYGSGGSNNSIGISLGASWAWFFKVLDNTGATVINTPILSLNPTVGTEYVIELDYDLNNGANSYCYINGVLMGTVVTPTTATYGSRIRIAVSGGSTITNVKFRDLVFFPTLQHNGEDFSGAYSYDTLGAMSIYGALSADMLTVPCIKDTSKVCNISTDSTGVTTIASSGVINIASTATLQVSNITDSSSPSTGSSIILGGCGIAKKLHTGDDMIVHSIADVSKISTFHSDSSGNCSLTTTGGFSLTSSVADATISGHLTTIAPTADLHCATKKYVDDSITNTYSSSFSPSASFLGAVSVSTPVNIYKQGKMVTIIINRVSATTSSSDIIYSTGLLPAGFRQSIHILIPVEIAGVVRMCDFGADATTGTVTYSYLTAGNPFPNSTLVVFGGQYTFSV